MKKKIVNKKQEEKNRERLKEKEEKLWETFEAQCSVFCKSVESWCSVKDETSL